MLSSMDGAHYITDRGGTIVWLGKHIRTRAATSSGSNSAAEQFKQVLVRLGENSQYSTGSRRPVCVCFHLKAVNGVVCPGVSTPSTVGFSADEIFEMSYIAGVNPNVRLMVSHMVTKQHIFCSYLVLSHTLTYANMRLRKYLSYSHSV